MLKSRATAWLVSVMTVAGVGTHPARGGTRRDDVPDSQYTSLAAQADYQAVGRIDTPGIQASGVLVADNYVLTAAHVGEGPGNMTFMLPSGQYVRAWTAINPQWTGAAGQPGDLALVRLSTRVLSEQPAALYPRADEVDKTGTLVGFGTTGTGLTGATLPGGTKRAGQNVWDRTGTFMGWSADVLLADFDNPNDRFDNWFGGWRPVALEYCIAPGDSGGGMFLSDGGVGKLAGIISFVAYRDDAADSDYGDAMGVVRISSHRDWLTSVLSAAYTAVWVGGSGGYNVAGNWQLAYGTQTIGAVPGSLDALRFQAPGSYVVTLPAADLSNARMNVAGGDVRLDLSAGIYSLTGGGLAAPSLVVGEAGSAGAALTIGNGRLSTQHAFLGPAAGGGAVSMTVAPGAAWRAGGSVFVGGSDAGPGGPASLTIAADAEVSVAGEMTVWSGGQVHLAGGLLEAGKLTVIGGLLSGEGTIVGEVLMRGGTISPGTAAVAVGISAACAPAAGVSEAPEPASIILLCLGLGAMSARRRRRAG